MLLQDYGVPEGIVDVLASEEVIDEKISLILGPETSMAISHRLADANRRVIGQIEDMWSQVFSCLGQIQ
jgi:hypothetical protein